jgi:hypothetical protein
VLGFFLPLRPNLGTRPRVSYTAQPRPRLLPIPAVDPFEH